MQATVYTMYLNECHYSSWSDLVIKSSQGSVYALPEYLACLSQVTGGKFSILGVFDGDELVGGIPLYFQKHYGVWVATARFLLSYNGPILKDVYETEGQEKQAIWLMAIETVLRTLNCHALRIRIKEASFETDIFTATAWQARNIQTIIVDLHDLEALWARLHRNARRLIVRARSAGMVLSQDEDFDAFFASHQAVHERKNTPLYLPKQAFRDYFYQLQKHNLVRLYHARMPNGRVLASQLVVAGAHPLTHTVCAGSLDPHAPQGENAFLRWSVYERLASEGYRRHDLSGFGHSASLDRFKCQLGGDVVTNLALTRLEPWWRPWLLRVRRYLRS
jgi:hypothetical protein